MEIRLLEKSEELPMDLLLEADPSEELVYRYCSEGSCYVGSEASEMIGVLVLCPLNQTVVEISNIAVAQNKRGQGLGKKLIFFALSEANRLGYTEVFIGTGNSSVNQLILYQKCGFRLDSIDLEFFTRNYSEPIFENGLQCRDMIRLKYTF